MRGFLAPWSVGGLFKDIGGHPPHLRMTQYLCDKYFTLLPPSLYASFSAVLAQLVWDLVPTLFPTIFRFINWSPQRRLRAGCHIWFPQIAVASAFTVQAVALWAFPRHWYLAAKPFVKFLDKTMVVVCLNRSMRNLQVQRGWSLHPRLCN